MLIPILFITFARRNLKGQEIGHNIGCGHNLATPEHYSPYAYGHGYVNYIAGNMINSWRTMMAYSDTCGGDYHCIRIPYWSNPSISYNGVPTGNIYQCNNARVWNDNASNVSQFKMEPNNLTITSNENSTNMNYAHWRASQTITVDNGYIVNSGQIVKLSAASSVILKSGTKIMAGAKFLATTDYSYPSSYPQFFPEQHNQQNEFPYPPTEEKAIIISPNPASSDITITLNLINKFQAVSISIFDISGQIQQNIINLESVQSGIINFPINISNMSNGLLLVMVEVNGIPYVNKIIKQ
ncbi:MAG: zinc-dependent metalloprotease [Paludibacteraceae bacterium]|nr:zinc-dependent metalloprotease [Paludibacteraceae bacterium]